MTFWFCAVSFFAVEIGYGLLPDDIQYTVDWEVAQFQMVLLAGAAYGAVSYTTPVRKGFILLALLWAAWVFLTDTWFPYIPHWVAAIEGALFLGWLFWLRHRDETVSSGKATGRLEGDAGLHPDGDGRGGSRNRAGLVSLPQGLFRSGPRENSATQIGLFPFPRGRGDRKGYRAF